MRVGLLSAVLAAVGIFSSSSLPSPVSALTNGTLLPSYMCGPPNDGLPKSIGGVLPFFQLATNPGPGPQVMDGVTKIPGRPLDAPLGTVLNTQLILAGFHSAAVQDTTITATKNPIQIAIRQVMVQGTTTAIPNLNAIAPGLDVAFSVQATPNGVFDINTALDGGIVWATDAAGNRIGQFVNTGANMQVWAACGPNNVGVVHNQLLSCTGEYPAAITDAAGNTTPAPVTAGLIWRAPANLKAGQVITFQGAGVTDLGFGTWTQQFTVAAAPALPPASPCITMVNSQVAGNSIVFFNNNAATVAGHAVAFTMNIVDVTQANKLVVSAQKIAGSGPALFMQSALIAKAGVKSGDVLSITITATNAQGATVSKPVQITVGKQVVVAGNCASPAQAAAAKTQVAHVDSASLRAALCDPVTAAEAARFGIDHDEDHACKYAAALDEHIGAAAAAQGMTGFLEMDHEGKFVPSAEYANKQSEFQAKSFLIGLGSALGTIGLMGAAAYAINNKKQKESVTKGYTQTL